MSADPGIVSAIPPRNSSSNVDNHVPFFVENNARPKHDPSVPRWANGRPPFTERRAIAVAEKRRWETQRELLAQFVDADRAVDAFRAGRLEGLVTWDQLAIGMTVEQRVACRGSLRRVLVRLAAALVHFVAPGLVATHAQLAPLCMLSERQTRRVLHELVALELLRAPEPTFEPQRAVHNRRANGYQLATFVHAAALAPHVVLPAPVPRAGDMDRARVLGQKNGQASGTESTYALRISAAAPSEGGRAAAPSTNSPPECPAKPDTEKVLPDHPAPAAGALPAGPAVTVPTRPAPQQLRTALVSSRSDVRDVVLCCAQELNDPDLRDLVAILARPRGAS